MPDNIYEVIAQGARYWFLFWMALIVWRSWRWYRKDRRTARKRMKLLPDAGFVGEMVVVEGGAALERGTVFPLPHEGTIGALRTNDLCLPAEGISRRHAWFRFDDRQGLMVEPFAKCQLMVDGQGFQSRRDPLYMGHGSWLQLGGVTMRLRLFAGFEGTGHAVRMSGADVLPQQPMITPEQYAQMQQWQMQQAYQQGYQQAMAQQNAQAQLYEETPYAQPQQENLYADDPDALPYDMAQIAREEGMVDNRIFMRPEGQKKPELPIYEDEQAQKPAQEPAEETVLYPPVADDEPDMDDWLMDEDMTDAAQPPKSAYVGRDEAERAKRRVWDKYFGGGDRP